METPIAVAITVRNGVDMRGRRAALSGHVADTDAIGAGARRCHERSGTAT